MRRGDKIVAFDLVKGGGKKKETKQEYTEKKKIPLTGLKSRRGNKKEIKKIEAARRKREKGGTHAFCQTVVKEIRGKRGTFLVTAPGKVAEREKRNSLPGGGNSKKERKDDADLYPPTNAKGERNTDHFDAFHTPRRKRKQSGKESRGGAEGRRKNSAAIIPPGGA